MVRCCEDVISLPQESLSSAWVVVPTSLRREHHDNTRLFKGAGGLVIVSIITVPDVANGIIVPASNPYNSGVFLSVFGVRGQIRSKFTYGGFITDQLKSAVCRRGVWGPFLIPLPYKVGIKAFSGF